jgi:hypothetical protein
VKSTLRVELDDIWFRIDSHTIKRGSLMLNNYLRATRYELTLHMHRTWHDEMQVKNVFEKLARCLT